MAYKPSRERRREREGERERRRERERGRERERRDTKKSICWRGDLKKSKQRDTLNFFLILTTL